MMNCEKVLVAVLVLVAGLFISENVFAMTLSRPVEIGKIVHYSEDNGFEIVSAASNEGIEVTERDDIKRYTSGTATFGSAEETLYFYYEVGTAAANFKDATVRFGSRDSDNTVDLSHFVTYACTIFKIDVDDGSTMYLLANQYDGDGVFEYALLGRRRDGSFVKYFDTTSIKNYYFKDNTKKIGFNNARCVGDTIFIDYGTYDFAEKLKKGGSLRFPWDAAAQWFGVEISY